MPSFFGAKTNGAQSVDDAEIETYFSNIFCTLSFSTSHIRITTLYGINRKGFTTYSTWIIFSSLAIVPRWPFHTGLYFVSRSIMPDFFLPKSGQFVLCSTSPVFLFLTWKRACTCDSVYNRFTSVPFVMYHVLPPQVHYCSIGTQGLFNAHVVFWSVDCPCYCNMF